MYLLIPMSGQGNRFKDKGYAQPKPLIPINPVTGNKRPETPSDAV